MSLEASAPETTHDLSQRRVGWLSTELRVHVVYVKPVSLHVCFNMSVRMFQVLYNMFNFVADMPEVAPVDVFLGVARFFVVGLGGMGFGILFGFVAAFTTRFTSKVREIEPLFIFMYSYLAYLVAELFAISSIMA